MQVLGRHGSVSLCRNKMAATMQVLAFKRQYFTPWGILRSSKPLDLLSAVAATIQYH